MKQDFGSLLISVLEGRKPTPWGEVLGFNKATTSRLFTGKQPGSEILTAIMRKENVSLSWLLEERGKPFMIDQLNDPDIFAHTLETHLDDDIWEKLHITNSYLGLNLILEGPAEYDYKGTAIRYRAVEVMTGPADQHLCAFLGLATEKLPVFIHKLDEHTANEITDGGAGTYKLFGDEKTEGYLSHPDGLLGQSLITLDDLISASGITTKAVEPADPQLLRAVIKQFEDMLTEEGLVLSTEARARAISAIYRHTERTGEVDPLVALAVIEASTD